MKTFEKLFFFIALPLAIAAGHAAVAFGVGNHTGGQRLFAAVTVGAMLIVGVGVWARVK